MDAITTPANTDRRPPPSWRKYLLVGLAMFAVTVALLYLVENWRGKQAWMKYTMEFQAKGKSLNWAHYIPPPVPDEQNIFKAPGMSGFIKGEPPTEIILQIQDLAKVVSDRASKEGVVVARLILVAPGALADMPNPDMPRALTPEEFVAEIERRVNRRLFGAAGIDFLDDFSKADPVRMVTPSGKAFGSEDIAKLLPDLSVRAIGGNQFEIVLEKTVPASEYLRWSNSAEGDLKAVRAALERPSARMDGDYHVPFSTPIQDFVAIRSLAQLLGQQAQCHLLLGRPEQALEKLMLVEKSRRMLEGAPPVKEPTTLVTAMVSVAINGLYVSMIGDGLRLRVWKDAELAMLVEQLRRIELLPLVNESFNAELVAITHRSQTVPPSQLYAIGEAQKFRSFDLLPRGWTYQNMLTYARMMERQIQSVESSLPFVVPRKLDQAAEELEAGLGRFSPYVLLARLSIPNTRKAIQVATRNQIRIHQARVACALERYRLAHGHYPEELQDLVPQFLDAIPRDVILGEPMHYRRVGPEDFLLYSIGWNEKDDQGQKNPDAKQGDWVWSSNGN